MLTEERIEKFYADLQALGLKRPIAEVSKATGYSKGNVSEWISRKKEPSLNFIEKFYKEFYKTSNIIDLVKSDPLPGTVTLKDHIELLKQWRADAESKYQDAVKEKQGLIEALKIIGANLKQGQQEIKEQILDSGKTLADLMELHKDEILASGRLEAKGSVKSKTRAKHDGEGKSH